MQEGDNIKAFLEADARRTQGEWYLEEETHGTEVCTIHQLSSGQGWGYIRSSNHNFYNDYKHDADANFIAAASRIAPDLAKMVEDMRVAKEALRRIASTYEVSMLEFEGFAAAESDPVLREAEAALTRLKPYEKLFEKEGEVR